MVVQIGQKAAIAFLGLLVRFMRVIGTRGVPPVKWSTFWDNFIPRYGGSKDDSQTGKGRRHSYEASAG